MPRLRNTQSGAVVNVDDATAARLGLGWESTDAEGETKSAAKKSAPRRRKAATSTTKSDDE